MVFESFENQTKTKTHSELLVTPEMSRARLKPIAQKSRGPRMLAVCFSFTEISKTMKFR